MAGREGPYKRDFNTTSYVHPKDENLNNLHKTMQYNGDGEPVLRTHVDGINLNGDVIVDKVKVEVDAARNTIGPDHPVPISGTSDPNANTNPIFVSIQDGGNSITIDGSVNIGSMPEIEIKNDTGNPIPISKNTNTNSNTNPIFVQGVAGGSTGDFPDASVTSFEEPLAVGITPVFQGSTVYGIDPDFWTKTELRGGSVSVTDFNLFQVKSGTSAGGYARLATNSYATYQPGQGLMFRWTAAFTVISDATPPTKAAIGITNIVQNTGPIDRESGFSIGYSGVANTPIGILHRRAGFAEVRQLTITQRNTGAQTAIVTLNDTAYTISLATSATTQYCAAQIAAQLKLDSTLRGMWDIEACGSTVTFSYYSPGSQNGTYSFSSSGTGTAAAGTFARLQIGASPIDTWIYQNEWNGTVPNFDPTKLNVYGMDMRWLGSGRIRFFMEDPDTGKMVKIHTITWTKNQTALAPHIRNPSLRIIYRSGTTNPAITPSQDVVVSGASVFAGIQGQIVQSGMSQGYYSAISGNRAQDTVHHVLSIQNPFIRNGIINKSSLIIQDLTMSAQGNDPSIIFIIKNPVGTSDLLVFNPVPTTNPFLFAQYSDTTVTENIALDMPSNIKTLGINSSAQFDLREYNLIINPGEHISVFFISTSVISRTACGMTWRVD